MSTKDPSIDHLIDYIAGGDGSPRAWGDMSITVNLSGLDGVMLESAQTALDIWSTTTGFSFTEAAGAADIVFGDEADGAFTSLNVAENGEIVDAFVNVSEDWMDGFPADARWDVGDYGLQTFVHEIGHALGLQHPGPYNGTGDYDDDAIFVNDTWQYTIMSYFDQSNTYDDPYFISGPGLADVGAIVKLYGELDLRSGDTSYTLNSMHFEGFDGTFTIVDSGGDDTLDLSDGFGSQVDLRDGAFSRVGVRDDNLAIAPGSIIENALGGQGDDELTGNQIANELYGGGGADRLTGGAGDDTLVGGLHGREFATTGKKVGDVLSGGAGDDTFIFASAKEFLKDEIRGFKTGSDIIDLSSIDAVKSKGGDQEFDFIGTRKFTGEAGQLHYEIDRGTTFLSGDINGDKKADFVLELNGKISFGAGDFVL